MAEMTRKEFMQVAAGAVASLSAASSAMATVSAPEPGVPSGTKSKMKLGVSTYSYHQLIRDRKMTFEDVLADISDLGAEGVEFLGEGAPPDYPNPSSKWVAHYFDLLDRLNLKPAAYDTHLDTTMFKGSWQGVGKTLDYKDWLPVEKTVEYMEVDFKLAHRLGFKTLRQHVVPYPPNDPQYNLEFPYVRSKRSAEALMKAIPLAEKYDTRMALELHSPTKLTSPFVEMLLEIIEKTKTKHLGFTIDFSVFMRRPPRVALNGLVRHGARQNIVDYIVEAYLNKLGPDKTVAAVKKMGGNELELKFAGIGGIYHSSDNEIKDLKPLFPYVYHCHAKFHEITEELKEPSIPYEEILPAFAAAGYEGFLDSEYEPGGSPSIRLIYAPNGEDTESAPDFTTSAAIRAQHTMMRRIMNRA